MNEQVKMQREILLQTLKFLNDFEKNFPNKNLVISPHPNEKLQFWENYISKKKFKNRKRPKNFSFKKFFPCISDRRNDLFKIKHR